MNKQQARKKALEDRKNKDQSLASSIVLDAFLVSKVLEKYTHIGIYYPIGKEINVMSLVDEYPEKRFYLPVTKDTIDFIPYDKNTNLVQGPFHTMEPEGKIVDRDSIECFIIPCVGIVKDKKRIGYGKGYYDRYLNGYHGVKIGVVYKDAIFDIEGDSFDISMDIVIKG